MLTSIGLNITTNTNYYPVSTAVGAVVNVGLNFLLIPSYGMLGAAWANGASYAVQSGIAYHFSQRFYPIPHERARIASAVAAAILAYVVAIFLPAMPPLAGLLARGTTVVAVMGGVLWTMGFFNPDELRWLNSLRQLRRRTPVTRAADATEMAGEIVSVDVPDDLIDTSGQGRRR